MAPGRRVSTLPIFIIFILLIVFDKYSCNAPVPVLIWTNSRSLQNENVVLGHTLSNKDVVSKHLDPVLKETNENLIVFLQDKLSIDDFTKYAAKEISGKKSVFDNLKKFLDHQKSVVLPSVFQKEDERELVQLLQEKFHGHVEEIFSTDLDDWKASPQLSQSNGNLLIFHLKPLKGSTEDGKTAILSSNDDVVGRITEQMNALGPYTALLTSNEPSDIVENLQNQMSFDEESNHPDFQRHLLATVGGSESKTFYNFSNCFYMYAVIVKFQANETNGIATFTNVSHSINKKASQCHTNHSSIAIKYHVTGNVTKFDLSMHFKTDVGSSWKCSKIQVTYSDTSSIIESVYNFSCDSLAAPATMFSYSCGNSTFKSMNGSTTLATLILGHFQIQPFGVSGDKFASAYDCTPFFTIPILTGIFVGLILIAIIFWGVFSILGIQTMDRFDDPKGQTIQVPHE